MIAADQLVPRQVYYLAGTYRPEAWRYVGSITSATSAARPDGESMYIFINERHFSQRFFAVELISFFLTEREAWRKVIENLNLALKRAEAQATEPEPS